MAASAASAALCLASASSASSGTWVVAWLRTALRAFSFTSPFWPGTSVAQTHCCSAYCCCRTRCCCRRRAGDVTTPRGQIGVKTDNTILTFYRTGLNMKFAWNDHVIQALLVLLGNKTDGAIEACFRLYYSAVPRCHLDASPTHAIAAFERSSFFSAEERMPTLLSCLWVSPRRPPPARRRRTCTAALIPWQNRAR